MIKNKWIISHTMNQHSRYMSEFLEFSDYNTFEELADITPDDRIELVDRYEEYLKTINKTSTRLFKLKIIDKFYDNGGWDIQYTMTKHSDYVLRFLEFSEHKTLDDLVNLSVPDVDRLLEKYDNYLKIKYADSTRNLMLECVELFYKINGFKFKPYETPKIK